MFGYGGGDADGFGGLWVAELEAAAVQGQALTVAFGIERPRRDCELP